LVKSAFQPSVALLPRKQVLHYISEVLAAARKLHHPVSHATEQESPEKKTVCQSRSEFQEGAKKPLKICR
jgi:hypothetical protein